MRFPFCKDRTPKLTPIGGLVTAKLLADINYNFAALSERIARLEADAHPPSDVPYAFWLGADGANAA